MNWTTVKYAAGFWLRLRGLQLFDSLYLRLVYIQPCKQVQNHTAIVHTRVCLSLHSRTILPSRQNAVREEYHSRYPSLSLHLLHLHVHVTISIDASVRHREPLLGGLCFLACGLALSCTLLLALPAALGTFDRRSCAARLRGSVVEMSFAYPFISILLI